MSMFGGHVPVSAQVDPLRKSNHRHWCPYCKLFISPTKSAILNHEKGDVHKANVQQHLNGIYKKKGEEQKAQNEMDKEIKKLMEVGERAYREKDLGLGKPSEPTRKETKAAAAVDPATGIEFHPYKKKSTNTDTTNTAAAYYTNQNYSAQNYSTQNYSAQNYTNQNNYDYSAYYNDPNYANYYNNYYNNAAAYDPSASTSSAASAAHDPSASTTEGEEGTEGENGVKKEETEEGDNEGKLKEENVATNGHQVAAELTQREYIPAPGENTTGFGAWETVVTRIVSSDEEDDDDEIDSKTRLRRELKRKRKQEESAPPEPVKEDSDDEDSKLRPMGYDKCTIDEPTEPVVFKRTNNKQRNIRKK